MARNKPTKIKAVLKEFLFFKIKNDPDFKNFSQEFEVPVYVTENLHPEKKLRKYQKLALKYFIYLFEKGDIGTCKHLMFNMATGSGKTLVMAACMLYLYEKGYRNFIFLVNQIQILEQARKNFTDYKFSKYLFNPKGIYFNGRLVQTREIRDFQDGNESDINLLFLSTSLFYNYIKEDGENRMTADDLAQNDVVIIADEAHHLNVETKSKRSKIEEKEKLNWENAVQRSLRARQRNLLLEFTATVELDNDNIRNKYLDKLIFKYDFLDYNKDGYSKDVQFLFNNETQVEDQKRLLIVHAVTLSQYRKMLFWYVAKSEVNPVVLLKSRRIADSEKDREFFNQVVANFRVSDLEKLKKVQSDPYGLIGDMFKQLGSLGISLEEFVATIRSDFSPHNTLIYNSQKKETPWQLAELDNPRNRIRAVFSVNALNEGWDVLSLFDIIHFDISAEKKVASADIQLIGRGARYCPFTLPENKSVDDLFNTYSNYPDRRKFDQTLSDSSRIMETLYYHFVKTGLFLEGLQEELLGEGIINDGVERRTIKMKEEFIKSETYQKGFILVNRTEKRQKSNDVEEDATFNRILQVSFYELHARALTNREENELVALQEVSKISLKNDFSKELVKKALIQAENGFFRFYNLKQHLVNLISIDDFIDHYLTKYEIKYFHDKEKTINKLTAKEKLQLLKGIILPEVRKNIDLNLPKIVGSPIFRPVSIKNIFEKQKDIFIASFPMIDEETGKKEIIQVDEKANPQTGHDNLELRLNIALQNWYAYDENYGTSEEKRFVKFMAGKIDSLRDKYGNKTEIYLLRNELDYWIFNLRDGHRFSPDYLLFINDVENKKMYYQCIFEVKGSHLLDKDSWKEEGLLAINELSKVSFKADKDETDNKYQNYLDEIRSMGYREIKNIGFSFYNNEENKRAEFTEEFQEKLLN